MISPSLRSKHENHPYTCAVIAAAGSGTRMGSEFDNKLFIKINGKPLIFYTLNAFAESETVDEIILVTKEDCFDKLHEIVSKYGFDKKVSQIIKGGAERQQSICNAVEALPDITKYICVHDGARPFITPSIINRVNNCAYEHKASACCVKVKDTIKKISGDFIKKTVDRETLRSAQTPQCFNLEMYVKALKSAVVNGANFTDDCQLFEKAGYKVFLCEGSYDNIKVTTKEDVGFAEYLIKSKV